METQNRILLSLTLALILPHFAKASYLENAAKLFAESSNTLSSPQTLQVQKRLQGYCVGTNLPNFITETHVCVTPLFGDPVMHDAIRIKPLEIWQGCEFSAGEDTLSRLENNELGVVYSSSEKPARVIYLRYHLEKKLWIYYLSEPNNHYYRYCYFQEPK